MSVEVNDNRVVLTGRCGVEEAEPLLAALSEVPGRVVVLQAERLHTALWQVLIALQPTIEGQPRDAFVMEHVLPLVINGSAPVDAAGRDIDESMGTEATKERSRK